MPDFDAMSDAEIREWTIAVQAESARKYADRPRGPISRAKYEDVPQFRFKGYTFHVRNGRPVAVWRSGVDPEVEFPLVATLRGLHRRADGSIGVGVELPDGSRWSVMRADGQVWTERIDAPRLDSETKRVEVVAEGESGGRGESWVVQTAALSSIEGFPPFEGLPPELRFDEDPR